MSQSLSEIASLVGGTIKDRSDVKITGIAALSDAVETDISFLANSRYLAQAKVTRAAAVITDRQTNIPGKNQILVDDPSSAFILVADIFMPKEARPEPGIHPTAVIASSARIAEGVSVGPAVVIEDDVEIGKGCVIRAGAFIGQGSRLGGECQIFPRVVIHHRTVIGSRVIVQSSTVIGSDGYGYITINGKHCKIPQQGYVEIEDDVEIGAGCTIDRARFDKTLIGRGTKIDNLVQIAHNVRIGEHCLIVAQVGVSGSTQVGHGAILAGQAGIAGHLKIGDHAVVTGQAGVSKDVPAGVQVSGTPARESRLYNEAIACLYKLPNVLKQIKDFLKGH